MYRLDKHAALSSPSAGRIPNESGGERNRGFLLLQFIHVLRPAGKNIARYHSYFIGPAQNGLPECVALSQCGCNVMCTPARQFPMIRTNFFFFFFFLFFGGFYAECLPASHDCHMTSLAADESQCVCVKLPANSTILITVHDKKLSEETFGQ